MSSRQLRQQIRQQRRSLPAKVAVRYAEEMAHRTARHPLLLNSQQVAAYLSSDGEIDPWPLLLELWSLGKAIYLPVLTPFDKYKLWFAAFEPGDELAYNRFGIPEPVRRRLIKPCALDVVLTPLVAFDEDGHRIGMGGGYYDRSFAFINRHQHWQKPRLLGLAYELQKRAAIKPNTWDIPLHAIATEATIYTAAR